MYVQMTYLFKENCNYILRRLDEIILSKFTEGNSTVKSLDSSVMDESADLVDVVDERGDLNHLV